MLKDVTLLSQAEEKEFLQEVENHPTFQQLKVKVEETFPNSTQNLVVTESIKGVAVGEDREVNFKSVVLLDKERKAKIYVIESTLHDNEKRLNVAADVATEDGKSVVGFMNKFDKVDLIFTAPFDPKYFEENRFGVELSSKERDELKAQEWYGQFCLIECAGQYNHCGPGCGQYGPLGGGSLINKIDGCCYIHDYCYHNKIKSKGCCDKDLVTCVTNNKSVDYCAYLDIVAVFSWSDC
ncbi:hypothetical protein GTHT12_03770 (plasmid) [Geobacillus thermodenitrificans]|jgi:hypothetical protein|uniref:hypothetical protein n=1 Tax=Geobacillus thermodenitrificans TaxID=33940 RepID=UPI000A28EE92|nr:hypothetical protein [Geobacillus thermodenitrificans]ARP44636.1 hypothetical protein GTHT12_03770 [Geobacillus thermodenitrificans]